MYLGFPAEKNTVDKGSLSEPACTLTGSAIPPLVKGLPKNTQSLCPECLAVISAREYEQDGKVLMTKKCHQHGVFNDIIASDVRIFHELERWHFKDGSGFENPQVTDASKCPTECGICNMHATHTSVANIDITGRCNLSCNICFADSNKSLYEPSLDEITVMLERLRNTRPAPCTTIQYTGGEPTVHPQFLDIVRKSKELGFTHIQCATNGLKFADLDFAEKAREAGLQYLYLQMDGVTDDVFEKIRGRRLLETKLKTIEGSQKSGTQDHLRSHHNKRRQRPPDRRSDPTCLRQPRRDDRYINTADRIHREISRRSSYERAVYACGYDTGCKQADRFCGSIQRLVFTEFRHSFCETCGSTYRHVDHQPYLPSSLRGHVSSLC